MQWLRRATRQEAAAGRHTRTMPAGSGEGVGHRLGSNGEWRMANGEWRMANGEWRHRSQTQRAALGRCDKATQQIEYLRQPVEGVAPERRLTGVTRLAPDADDDIDTTAVGSRDGEVGACEHDPGAGPKVEVIQQSPGATVRARPLGAHCQPHRSAEFGESAQRGQRRGEHAFAWSGAPATYLHSASVSDHRRRVVTWVAVLDHDRGEQHDPIVALGPESSRHFAMFMSANLRRPPLFEVWHDTFRTRVAICAASGSTESEGTHGGSSSSASRSSVRLTPLRRALERVPRAPARASSFGCLRPSAGLGCRDLGRHSS
ncbi:MAG: hypothetical protein ACI9CV_000107 [Ilumatobacter sp.]|jgi:hypothetical protein